MARERSTEERMESERKRDEKETRKRITIKNTSPSIEDIMILGMLKAQPIYVHLKDVLIMFWKVTTVLITL